MTALGKLLRTTVLKLSLAYLVIFAIGAGVVLGRVAFSVKGLMDQQISQTIDEQITSLSEQYNQGGLLQLVQTVMRRSRAPGASLYLVTTPAGEAIAGNVAELPPGVLDKPGVVETPYDRIGENPKQKHFALARIFKLPGGFRLLVGRDLEDRENLRFVMGRALAESLLWLVVIGTVGGIFVAMRVLRRVDAMSAAARTIMRGDLAQRLPVNGSGDEFDRLAESLNAMLTRISELMEGVKEVSDNIAHDLKTPLTRIRNGAEQALRTAQSPDEYRLALERLIEEADGVMAIFNALLMIARAEAGPDRALMEDFDLSEAVRDVGELYEPVAESQSVALNVSTESNLWIHGSRELIGQTLANLIENALKYGVTNETAREISIEGRRVGSDIELAVADHGPGIPAADRARALNRFVRLEGSRSLPGSGLGLSLAAAVVRMHDSTLSLQDNAPGLRVVMHFPAAPARVLALAAPAPEPAPSEADARQ